MAKHSVNLVIRKVDESPYLTKAKIYLPVIAVVSLVLFVISFLASILYISNNSQEFNAVNARIDNLQRRISASKNTEGVYTLTFFRIKTSEQLSAGSKNYTKLLSEILKFQSEGILVSQTTVDKKNAVTVSVTASSSAAMDDLITALLKADASKLFTNIASSGIVRDKTGNYLFTLTLAPNISLLQ